MNHKWIPERGKWLESLKRFLRKPWPEKMLCMKFVCLQVFGVVPVHLPHGGWWLAYNDYIGNKVLDGSFENAECRFVAGVLGPGMTVLDIGAHHGLYTLLAARRVGPNGRVVAFEPSPREQRKLALNVCLSRCVNVQIEHCALGSSDSEADFFIVDGMDTGCNSLRPPNVKEPTKLVQVPVRVLDACLKLRDIDRVDFIKMDVEGGELEVLKGAYGLLDRRPRPIIVCEVQEIRTEPWGYKAKEVIEFLRCRKFHWFRLSADGALEAVDGQQADFDGNFIAVPEERLGQIHRKTQWRKADLEIRVAFQS
jgi:FkbM family methyltransferase